MKFLRLFLCFVAFSLSACMSHVLLDTSTRLQVENKTDVTILGLDVISEDGTSVQPWIKETVAPGEKSKVVEQDWVGTFRVRVRFDKWDKYGKMSLTACEAKPVRVQDDVKVDLQDNVMSVALAKQSEVGVTHEKVIGCDDKGEYIYAELELDFEGGSQYLVVSEDEDGKAVFRFR